MIHKRLFILDLHIFIPRLFVPQRQSELQQSGGEGSVEAAGEAEGSGGRHGAEHRGTGQPPDPTGHGPQKPQQVVPRLAGLGVDHRGRVTFINLLCKRP